MKKYNNFLSCFQVLKSYDPKLLKENALYRMGVIGQFNLTFELAWKLLQAVLLLHGVSQAQSGSPREIVKLGFKSGFISDEEIWLDVLRQRNNLTHIYSEENAENLVTSLIQSYIPALERFQRAMKEKIEQQ